MPTPRRADARTAALLLLAAVALVGLVAPGAAAQDTSHAPTTTLSNGGRSVSDGVRSLSVSQAADLDPAGQTISVSGGGFDPNKGIYVAFCLIPPTDQPPTPCGGGRGDENSDTGGASLWLRSDDYGAQNSATPFGPGGSFSTTMTLAPEIAPGIDCRQARCAVVTRADHKATADRSLDLFVPVTFGAPRTTAPGTPTSTTVPPAAPAVSTTLPPLQPQQVAPSGTVDADGTSVSDGTRTLRATDVAGLDPTRAEVAVSGQGYDTAKGIYVALCAVPAVDPALPAGAAPTPGPCTSASEGAAAWISSNPPDYGKDLAVAYGPDGAFSTDLALSAVIDADHDCREVDCAIVSRNDDTNAGDRTQDLYLPVTFAARSSQPVEGDEEEGGTVTAAADDEEGGSALPLIAGGGAVVVVLGVVGGVLLRRRRGAAGSGPGTP